MSRRRRRSAMGRRVIRCAQVALGLGVVELAPLGWQVHAVAVALALFALACWARTGALVRPGTVYGLRVRDPRSGRVVIGYVGKTRRHWRTRIHEHLHGSADTPPKAWAPTVTEPFVLWHSPRCTAFGLWWREVWFIRTRRPLYNIQHNTRNRRRVPPWQVPGLVGTSGGRTRRRAR